MSILGKISSLTRQLYPTGRAFKAPPSGSFKLLHDALNLSEAKAYADALSILDSALPDNDNFTTADATLWERRLGLISNATVSLSDRKLAILRKMAHPGNVKPRQHALFIQKGLRDAGFDVYVHENIFNDSGNVASRDPRAVAENVTLYGQKQMGQFQYSAYNNLELVANSIEESEDSSFNVVDNYRNSFFIGGVSMGQYTPVSIERKAEFRQLILRLKPLHTIAYLFINYT